MKAFLVVLTVISFAMTAFANETYVCKQSRGSIVVNHNSSTNSTSMFQVDLNGNQIGEANENCQYFSLNRRETLDQLSNAPGINSIPKEKIGSSVIVNCGIVFYKINDRSGKTLQNFVQVNWFGPISCL